MAKRKPKPRQTQPLEPDEDVRISARIRRDNVKAFLFYLLTGGGVIVGGGVTTWQVTKETVQQSAPNVEKLTDAVVDLKTEVVKTRVELAAGLASADDRQNAAEDRRLRDREEFIRRIGVLEKLIDETEDKAATRRELDEVKERVKALEDAK